MPYDKDQKLSPEESPENREGQGGNKPENRPQEEKYSFLQETITYQKKICQAWPIH